MASLHLAVSGDVPAGSTYGSAFNTTVPKRVAKPMPFLYTCQKCRKPYKIRKRMETHQLTCAGQTTKSRRNACIATKSIMPNVSSVHIALPAEPCAGTSCQKIQYKFTTCM